MTLEFDTLLAEMKPLLGKKAGSLRTAYTLGSPETRRAMEAWLQVQAARYLGKQVGENPSLLRPPEPQAVSGPFTIGTVMYHDRELHPVGRGELRPCRNDACQTFVRCCRHLHQEYGR